jgi:hypothetical protein
MTHIMAENHSNGLFTAKRRGRPPGAPNLITRNIREALRALAEGNADRVQSWLDSVAEKDPAEALRLWLGLLRYVTPTLQAAAIADVTPAKPVREQLAAMSEEELLECIVRSPEAAELVAQGVSSKDELLLHLANGAPAKAPPTKKRAPQGTSVADPNNVEPLR